MADVLHQERGLRILHVEDSIDHQLIMRSLLSKTGLPHEITQCDTRLSVKEQLAANPPYDLVLLDYLLADGSSEDMLGWFVGLPVVVVTVMEDEQVDSRVMQKGAADFVCKGELTPSLLKRIIRHALDRQNILNQLIEESWHDSLTGLHNRRFVLRELARLVGEHKRYGTEFSCTIIDVDGLKAINDTAGHLAGDNAIKHVAGAMSAVQRDGDIAARLGGDEFLLLFPNTSPQDASQCLRRMSDFLEANPLVVGNKMLSLTVSCGLVASSGEPVQKLLEKADKQLYLSKREGKNRINFS